MRPDKTGGDEERRPALAQALLGGLEPLDRLGGHAAVGVVGVGGQRRLVRCAPRQRTDPVQRLVREQRLLAGELAATGASRIEVLDHLIVKMWNAERVGVALVPVTNVEHLAKRLRAVAVSVKMLRQRHRVRPRLAQMTAQPVQAGRGRVRPEHQREAGRRTNRLVAVGQVEPHPPLGQGVDVWRSGRAVAVTAQRRF